MLSRKDIETILSNIKINLSKPVVLEYKKLLPDVEDPYRKYDTDSCFDLKAHSINHQSNYIEYGTGLVFNIPRGYELKVYPRSGISATSMMLANSVGVIDEDYTGELMIRMKNIAGYSGRRYEIGDRIAQVQLVKKQPTSLKEVDHIKKTPRGSGGFGSTGI
jgi:dUTP pyrophosphatase